MKIQRKLAGFSACALVLSSLTVPVAHAASTDFKDIDSHWAKSSIERWAGYEIVNGFGNNEFKPEDTMTRAQMAQILSKTLGLTATATTNPFTDVNDSDWFKDAILKCNAAGIMNGTSATTANPNAQISRQDAVTMMGRALGIEADGNSTTFDDNGSIGAWAVGFVNAMSKRGIVNGRSEGIFAPTGNIKRGEIATILDRAITTYVNTPDTEVTATNKGITLIAASGVTVKGEAEDILVAPAATGTTKLDGVKVSGAVTMQAAKGTLALSGATTAAKLSVPTLATGAKITIEKDATVAAMNSSADDVAIDGAGSITNMTVETGKGVTVAGSVKVGKITNNGSDTVKKGNTTVAANTTWNGTTTPSGGGGGSSGGGGGGNGGYVPPTTENPDIADSWDNFIAQASDNKDATPNIKANFTDARDEALIINNEASKIELDLSNATAKTFILRAEKAETINIKGSQSSGNQIETLILEAPNATVTSDIRINEAQVESVDETNSYHPTKPHQRINMKGKGKLVVDNENNVDQVEVSTKNPGDPVTIRGNVKNLTVQSPAQIILEAIASALNLDSKSQNANIKVESVTNNGSVTVAGTVDKLDVPANTSVTLAEDATVTTATTANGATITGSGSVNTLTAHGNVTVSGATVAILNTSTTTTTVALANGAKVTSITTTTSLTIESSGTGNTVGSVDVNAGKDATNIAIKAPNNVVEKVTTVGETPDSAVTETPTGATTAKKADTPKNVGGEHATKWNDPSYFTGVDTTMEYKLTTAAENASYSPIDAVTNGRFDVDAGTYFVRTKGTDATATAVAVEPSVPVTVVVPGQFGVEEAEILGTPVSGQTLKAVANSTKPNAADAPLKYEWTYNNAPIEGVKDTDAEITADKTGTYAVTISNYNGEKSAPAFVVVTDDAKKDLEALVAAVEAKLKDVPVKDAGTTPDQVEDGTKYFVDNDAYKALQAALTDAKAKLADTTTTQSDLSAALQTLNRANNAVQFETGTKKPDATTYAIKVAENLQNVTVTTEPTGSVAAGTEVTVTATPATGYDVDTITVTDANNTPVTVTDGKFTMPAAAVTVSATAVAKPAEDESQLTVAFADTTTGAITVTQGSAAPIEGTEKFNVKKNADVTVSVKFDRAVESATYVIGAGTATPMTVTGDTATATITKEQLANDVTMTITAKLAEATKSNVTVATDDITKKFNVAFTPESPVEEGKTVTVTIAPATGSDVEVGDFEVKVNDADTTVTPVEGETGKYTFKMPAKDVTISVTEKATTEKVTVTFDVGTTGAKITEADGTTEIPAAGKTVDSGSDVSFMVTGVTLAEGKTLKVTVGEAATVLSPEKDADGKDVYTIEKVAATTKVTVSVVDVVKSEATFTIPSNVTVTEADGTTSIVTGAKKTMSSDKNFVFMAKNFGASQNVIKAKATTGSGSSVEEVTVTEDPTGTFTIAAADIAALDGAAVSIVLTSEEPKSLSAMFTFPQNDDTTSVTTATEGTFKKDKDGVALTLTDAEDYVFTVATTSANTPIVKAAVSVGGSSFSDNTALASDKVKREVTADGTKFTIAKADITDKLFIKLTLEQAVTVIFQGTESSATSQIKGFKDGMTVKYADEQDALDPVNGIRKLAMGEALKFTVDLDKAVVGDKLAKVTITRPGNDDATVTIQPDKNGNTYTVKATDLFAEATENAAAAPYIVTVTVDVADAIGATFVGEGGTADTPKLPEYVTIVTDDGELNSESTSTQVGVSQGAALKFKAYSTGTGANLAEIEMTATVKPANGTETTLQLTKDGNDWTVPATYTSGASSANTFTEGNTVTIKVTATEKVTVGDAHLVDQFGAANGGNAQESSVVVTAKAEPASDTDLTNGADYKITLTAAANTKVPMHMNAEYNPGNWAGFALKHGEFTADNYKSGNNNKVVIHTSTVSFADAEGIELGNNDGNSKTVGTAHVQKGFDDVDPAQGNDVKGTFYFNLAKSKKLYVVLEWTDTVDQNTVNSTDKVVVDASGLELDSSFASALKNMQDNNNNLNNIQPTSLNVTYDANGKPIYTIEMASNAVSGSDNGIPISLLNQHPFDGTLIGADLKSFNDAHTTGKIEKLCAGWLPKGIFQGFGTNFIIKQENDALVLFSKDPATKLYQSDGITAVATSDLSGDNANTNWAKVATGIKIKNYTANSSFEVAQNDEPYGGYSFLMLPGGKQITLTVYKASNANDETITDSSEVLATFKITPPAATVIKDGTLTIPENESNEE